jgi:hypothetical protein
LHIQKIHRLLRAAVAIQTAATLSMRPASTPAEELAATACMHHRRLLHANISPMHATPTLTWCCCGKARATTEQQMMAHAQEQGKATCAAQVEYQWQMQSALCMQHSAMQDGNVAFGSAEVGDTGLMHKTMHESPAAGVG